MEVASLVHHFGTLLGFVGALVSAFLMLRLGDDDEIRRKRGRTVRRICLVTWTGLLMLLGSGVVMTLRETEPMGFLLHFKHTLVALIVVDAVLIHFKYFPQYFKTIGTKRFNRVYATMRVLGAISVTCWLAVIVLSVLMHL